jgi:hypothetical protein
MIDTPTKEEIEAQFKGTNFGRTDYETLVKQGLLKTVCGYHNGFTLRHILRRLGLIEVKNENDIKVTLKGYRALYVWFSIDSTV